MSQTLPAHALIEPLTRALASSNVIVGAPPGAGKSTVLPLALLKNNTAGKILLMQPRRVVVRNLAAYLASQLDEPVGQQVGYRIRGESKVSAKTRIEVITEGILARMIQQDAELHGVSLILFDEFHERSIHSDFGLALALEVQEGLREDLRLVVMSATLDVTAIQSLMPGIPVLTTQGRAFPVSTVYSGEVAPDALQEKLFATIQFALTEHKGDILVFLEGAGPINRLAQRLNARNQADVICHSLYGALSKEAQQAAILPDAQGRRKVILATNIAETSLTIENITVVIDSGMEKVATYHPPSGLTVLNRQRISRASATQRAGRAGRLGPGTCYRLWPESAHERLAPFSQPQILREDVTALLLDALSWGTRPENLALIDQPGRAQLNNAEATLTALNAVDGRGSLTSHGRALASISCHPKLAGMLLQVSGIFGEQNNKARKATACILAALAERSGGGDGAIHDYLLSLNGYEKRSVVTQARRYAYLMNIKPDDIDLMRCEPEDIALCLALAYPERIAMATREGRYKLTSGRAALKPQASQKWIVLLDGIIAGNDIQVGLYAPVEEQTLRAAFPHRFLQGDFVEFNPQTARMEARKAERFDELVVKSEPAQKVKPAAYADAWTRYLQSIPDSQWPLPENARQWWARVSHARRLELATPAGFADSEPWPDEPVSDWQQETLRNAFARCRTLDDISSLDWLSLLNQQLSWPQQDALKRNLPTTFTSPVGNERPLRYQPDGQVFLSVKMQEMYGFTQSVSVAEGKVPVIIELLSPAGRPLQTTSDLAGFWTGSYQEIKKEMKGRYPKHYWPEDPTTAQPTTRTKRAMN